MTVTDDAPGTASSPRINVTAISIAAGVSAALVAAAVAQFVGVGKAFGLLVAALGALALGYCALNRFEYLVLAVLGIRASLDVTKGIDAGTAAHRGGGLDATVIVAGGFVLVALLHSLAQQRAGAEAPRTLGRSPLHYPLLAFFAAAAASVLGSIGVGTSAQELLRVGTVVVMVLVIERLLVSPQHVERMLTAVFCSAIVPMLFGLRQVVSHRGLRIDGFTRAYGTFVHPNPFSIYLTFIIVMGVACWPSVEHGIRRIGLSIIILGCGACLFGTYTRSAWIACFLGLLVVGALQNRVLVGLLIVGAVAAALVVPSVSSRFSDLNKTSTASGATGNSLTWRVSYWSDVVSLSHENPVTGIGLKMIEQTTNSAENAHNDFLRVYVETGIFGECAYLSMLVGLGLIAVRGVRRCREGLARRIAVGFAGVFVAFVVLSVVSNVVSQVVLLWYFFAMALASWAMGRFAVQADAMAAEVAHDADPARQ